MKNVLTVMLIGLMTMFFASNAHAIIIGGDVIGGYADAQGGVFQQITPPIGDVGNNNQQSWNLFGFNEDQNIVLGAPLSVDVGPSLTLPTGETVASHYVFYDPPGTISRSIVGYVDFDADILGIITSRTNLDNSDFLANVSANYLSPSLRGLEAVDGDSATIDSTYAYRLNISLSASSPGDYIRVLTKRSPGHDKVIPEPSTMLMMGLASGLMFVRRFRK
ncbi:MAG: PEP-CTERM sorting domain-containing protein [Candidatus Omnitrophica bacterium]|nr:PEP-CTERM sorting domain-containing protein [Candidatus Omnitrophota bacterium]